MPTDVDLLVNLEKEICIRTMARRRNLFAPLDERQALVWRAHADVPGLWWAGIPGGRQQWLGTEGPEVER